MSGDCDTLAALDSPETGVPDLLARGAMVGRYVVLDQIGAGAMGVVYRAYDPELDRRVALKLLSTMQREGTAGSMRLQREAQAMARLSYPNVATVHDVGLVDGRIFLAMELVEGVTLTEWLEALRRPWREVIAVFIDAGRGLHAAHDKGLVHRDFKPDNVMVGDDGRVRVMDFGIARRVVAKEDAAELVETSSQQPLSVELTHAGAVVGTPAYMAPEQLCGEATDARSDQFAYCVALFEALYGERPFQGDSLASLSYAVLQGEVRALPAGRSVPQHVRTAVMRGLSAEPGARWPSMQTLVGALGNDPRRARTRAAAVAAVVAVGFTGVVARQVLDAHAEAECVAEGAQMDVTWSPDRRVQLRESLVRSGLAYVEDTADRTTELLSTYATAWRAGVVDACRTGAAREATVRVCFEDRLDAVETLLEVLTAADAPLSQYAVSSAAALPSVVSCSDTAWLALQPKRPDDPQRAAMVADAARMLHRARALASTLQYGAARDEAAAAQQAGASTDYTPLQIDAGIAIGIALESLGDLDGARSNFVEAYFSASQLGRDESEVVAATALAGVDGSIGGDYERGAFWLRVADAALHRLGEEDGVRRAHWHHEAAHIAELRGDLEAAELDLDRALELSRAEYGDAHPVIADLLNNQAVLHEVRGEYDRARDEYQAALTIRMEALGESHPDCADSYNNLANVERLAGNMATSERLHRLALDRYRAALGPGHTRVAYALNNLADLLTATERYDQAGELYTQALQITEAARGAQHPDVASILDNLATLRLREGRHDEAERLFQRALQTRKAAIGTDHVDYATSLNNLAIVRLEAGQLESAEGLYREALAIHRKTLGDRHPFVAIGLNNLGEVQRKRGHCPAAITTLAEALELSEDVLGTEHAVTGNVLGSLGFCQLTLGANDAALNTLRRALAISEVTALGADVDGEIRFTLARAIAADAGGSANAESVALVESATHHFELAGPSSRVALTEASRWLEDARSAAE